MAIVRNDTTEAVTVQFGHQIIHFAQGEESPNFGVDLEECKMWANVLSPLMRTRFYDEIPLNWIW